MYQDWDSTMLVAGMKRMCRVGLAAALVTALCVVTLIDMPPELPELPTDLPPTPAGSEPPGTRSIVAYSWARRLALDYRPSRECSTTETLSTSSLTNTSNEAEKTWLETIPGRLFLYTGHLDIRVVGYPSVRVIGVKREPALVSGVLFCTIWQEDHEGMRSFSMEALVSDIWLDEWGGTSTGYMGILITCPLPDAGARPSRVFVGLTACYQNTSHSLIVKQVENVTRESEFTLCIKGLDFDEDISERLIGFFELSRILGASMFYVYVFNVHENVTKALRLYEKSNVVRWFRLNLPGDLPNEAKARRRLFSKDIWMKRRMELIPYNHCFYDNLYSSEFIVPIDIDEMIIPLNKKTWSEVLDSERKRAGKSFKDYASYAVRNVYFFPELQKQAIDNGTGGTVGNDSEFLNYFHTLRTSVISPEGDSVKSFVSTERALTIHNHYALTTLNPSARRAYHLDPREVLKHHHRHCDNDYLDCNLLMRDTTIDESALKYIHEFKARVKLALSYLHIIM